MMSEKTTLLVQLQKPSGDWVDVGLLRGDGSRNWFEFVESYWELADRPVLGQVFEEHGRFWRPNAHVPQGAHQSTWRARSDPGPRLIILRRTVTFRARAGARHQRDRHGGAGQSVPSAAW